MPLEDWSHARAELTTLLELLLAENGDYLIMEDIGSEEIEENEDREPKEVNGQKEPVKVRGSLVALVERLDEEVSLGLVLSSFSLFFGIGVFSPAFVRYATLWVSVTDDFSGLS